LFATDRAGIFRVFASKRELEGGDYTMDHSTFIYLMGTNGDYLAHFSASGSVEDWSPAFAR
jgi:cytochrome oxidase Cu insertion factor (SCO1/SenC/PrrC family)